MATVRRALIPGILGGLLLAAPPAPAQAPAASSLTGRTVTTTGQTKPPTAAAQGSPSAPLPKPLTQAEMVKAQREAEARSKAWDARMRRTMGSICSGC